MKATYLLYNYPTFSETYVSTELACVAKECELDVISVRNPDPHPPDEDLLPFVVERDEARIVERTRAFAPDVIHTHWLWGPQFDIACRLARTLDRPLTIRSHSFDVLAWKPDDPKSPLVKHFDVLRSSLCLGILTFPFGVERLVRRGLPEDKLIPCRPVLNFQRFHDESPNGTGVMNTGAALPKKDFPAYMELAQKVRDRQFSLYPMGEAIAALRETNTSLGSPVTIIDPVTHAEMPPIFKRQEWLVYTADRTLGTVGWPVSIAEAQASGVGVCMPNLRPDVKDWVGPAGFVYDSLDEVAEIITQPFPDSMRRAGFEHARRSDVRQHLPLLTNLWKQACSTVAASGGVR